MLKPVISRYPVNWKHESKVGVNWKSDVMNFPANLPVSVELYYPKAGDLFFLSFIFFCSLKLLFKPHCCLKTIRTWFCMLPKAAI